MTLEVRALSESAHERITRHSGGDVAQFDVLNGFVPALAEVWPEE